MGNNHVVKRYVQEFPQTQVDNRRPKDHIVVLREKINDPENELIKASTKPGCDINFKNITVESAFKGLNLAISSFEDHLTDIETHLKDTFKSPHDLFKDLDTHLHRLDTAYNLMMIMVNLDNEGFSHPEITSLLDRYYALQGKRFAGDIWDIVSKYEDEPQMDAPFKKLLSIYRDTMNIPKKGLTTTEPMILELKNILRSEFGVFGYCLKGANSLISYTVDDPDILAAVANEYADCQDLHHRDRTPLKVTSDTYHRFMKVCPDRFVRRALWETYNKRCSPKATPSYNTFHVMRNIRATRRKVADKCGYRSHLEFRLKDTMAKTKINVLNSLDAIQRENVPKLDNCLRELSDYAYENHQDPSDRFGLQQCDLDYWALRYTYDILIGSDQTQLRSFFPLETFFSGLGNYLKNYLSIEMSVDRRSSNQFWSSEVQLLELKRNGRPFGQIVFDPFQSGSRRPEISYSRIKSRLPGTNNLPVRMISAPYIIDESTKKPHLSTWDVVNLFHCFVSVLQRLLYDYRYYELNVLGGMERDTVNLLPYFCVAHFLDDYKIIQSMSRRGGQKKIDSELADRITKSIHHFRPLKVWYELYKAHLDLEIYSNTATTDSIVDEVYRKYSPFERFSNDYDYCAMIEIFAGPDDGTKYADLWARQLANTCFLEAKTRGTDEGLKEFYSKLVDCMIDPDNLCTRTKLSSLLGEGKLESLNSGLGVL